ncbi:MAG: hypothetical protein EZS28_007574 [Streblomastix strix]|uniref:Uncharacterized protein n=1 Tax=Streblomastix strix TaxID=222440 RepID=A0A5J4WPN3_9EUKA|nr:MAG: hypothetical protein EZS28_007574 [Streblomastix strix]
MDHASDYNVVGDLLGLGEYILLEILSEFTLLQDVQQFLVVCKKIYQLLEHPRYPNIIQSIIQITPIFNMKEESQGNVQVNKFIHSDKNDWVTISINPTIREGIVYFESYIKKPNSSFKITKFERRFSSSAHGVTGSQSLDLSNVMICFEKKVQWMKKERLNKIITMDHASDYNLVGSLLGLGPDIFVQIISQMILPQDIYQMVQSKILISPTFIIREASQGHLEKNKFIHSNINENCTIALDPIIKEDIIRIEVIFEKPGGYLKSIGIADASCSFAASKEPQDDGMRNQRYDNGQRVAAEVDMTIVPRRLTFFIDDVEQPSYVIGFPEAIRFWVLAKFERLNQSKAKNVTESKAFKWGKKWR